MLAKSSSSRQKSFFSDRLNVSLDFHPNGGITGRLYPFGKLKTISLEINGLYYMINDNIILSFMSEFEDPNLETKSFTCFSGEIINYENSYDCLILRWVMEQDGAGLEWTDRDIEILFDSGVRDFQEELNKIRGHLAQYALEMIK